MKLSAFKTLEIIVVYLPALLNEVTLQPNFIFIILCSFPKEGPQKSRSFRSHKLWVCHCYWNNLRVSGAHMGCFLAWKCFEVRSKLFHDKRKSFINV